MARELLKVTGGRLLAVAMTVVLLLGPGRGAAQDPAGALPDELAVIAAACRENSARIKSLQMSGTIVLTGRRFEGRWDPIAEKSYNSQTREFSIWKDASNCRLDVTIDHEVDGETGEVIYHVPAYEHISSYAKIEREGGMDALKRKYGTPQHTTRRIVTPDQGYQYEPESNELELNIGSVAVRALSEEPEMQLSLNKVRSGFTVAESIDRIAELASQSGRSTEVIPLAGGQYRIRSTVLAPREGNPTHYWVSDMVVDLDQGGNVLSYVDESDGLIVFTGKLDYVNVEGAWVVSHAEIAQAIGPDGVPLANAVYDVHPESLRINQPIDPQVFTFEALAVRRGARVVDVKTHEQYLYDDVTLEEKIRSAVQRELEEDRARAAEGEAPQAESPVQPPQQNEAGPAPGVATAPAASQPAAPPVPGPTSRATTRPDTRPAQPRPVTPPVATRPATTRPESIVVLPGPNQPQAPTSAPQRRGGAGPSSAATVAAIAAGCVLAITLGLWKLRRRGATPRIGQ